jgi:hypothetical protein
MRPAIHIDDAECVRSADIKDEHALKIRQLDKLDAIRRQELTRPTGRLATCVRLELILPAILRDAFCPGLIWHLDGRAIRIRQVRDPANPQSRLARRLA